MDKTYTLQEISKFYPHNQVTESSLGFEIHPACTRQGREILIIPQDLPTICNDGIYTPIDLTAKWDDDVVNQILRSLDAGDYNDLYCAYCRFGVFWKDHRGRHIFQIKKPDQATHIQLIGIKDQVTSAGWMPRSTNTEKRLEYIAETYYCDPLPQTDEAVRGWILHCDFHTEPIRRDCAQRFDSGAKILL